MLLTLLSALGGMAVNVIPAFFSYMNRRQQTVELKAKYERDVKIAELKLQGLSDVEDAKMSFQEREHIRDIDRSTYNTGLFGALRASVRPVITYTLFFMFVFIKGYSFLWAMELGYDAMMAVQYVWDEPTQAIFAAIMGFWFGSRTVEKFARNVRS